MKKYNLNQMKRGWFIGKFTPSLFPYSETAVALMRYAAGSTHEAHYHEYITEYNLVVSGKCNFCINKVNYSGETDDILIVLPKEICVFTAIEDCILVVVKSGSNNDKFVVNE